MFAHDGWINYDHANFDTFINFVKTLPLETKSLDFIEKFGTDALRIGLVVGNTPGTSLSLDENKIKAYRNFANKVWNASRFVIMNYNPGLPRRSAPRNDDPGGALANFVIASASEAIHI